MAKFNELFNDRLICFNCLLGKRLSCRDGCPHLNMYIGKIAHNENPHAEVRNNVLNDLPLSIYLSVSQKSKKSTVSSKCLQKEA